MPNLLSKLLEPSIRAFHNVMNQISKHLQKTSQTAAQTARAAYKHVDLSPKFQSFIDKQKRREARERQVNIRKMRSQAKNRRHWSKRNGK